MFWNLHTHTHTTDKAAKCALRNNKMLVIVGYYYTHTHTQQRWRWRWRRSRLWLHGACLHIFFARFVLPLTLTFTFECRQQQIVNINCAWGAQLTNWAKTGKHKDAYTNARTHTHAESRIYTIKSAFTQINVHKINFSAAPVRINRSRQKQFGNWAVWPKTAEAEKFTVSLRCAIEWI